MFRWILDLLGQKRTAPIQRRPYRPSMENLETRLTPVVGAFTDLPAIMPGTTFEGVNFDGVVRLECYDASDRIVGGGTGSSSRCRVLTSPSSR